MSHQHYQGVTELILVDWLEERKEKVLGNLANLIGPGLPRSVMQQVCS